MSASNLAISLNATDNATRDRLMPINKAYPIEQLLAACKDYEMPRRRRITVEYILIEGVNASVADAQKTGETAERRALQDQPELPITNTPALPSNRRPSKPSKISARNWCGTTIRQWCGRARGGRY